MDVCSEEAASLSPAEDLIMPLVLVSVSLLHSLFLLVVTESGDGTPVISL